MGKAVNKLLKEIKKYLPPGAHVVIACSGGADSVALTDAVWQLRDECGYKIAVMHVEHGLRGDCLCLSPCKSWRLRSNGRLIGGGRSPQAALPRAVAVC